MTTRLGYQIEVHTRDELMNHFKQSSYEVYQINASPHDIHRVAPGFLMTGIHLRFRKR
jgi:hypothetical protein